MRCASCGSNGGAPDYGPEFDVPFVDYLLLITFLLACLAPALLLR